MTLPRHNSVWRTANAVVQKSQLFIWKEEFSGWELQRPAEALSLGHKKSCRGRFSASCFWNKVKHRPRIPNLYFLKTNEFFFVVEEYVRCKKLEFSF